MVGEGRIASGFLCPDCGSEGTHDITSFIETDAITLHCRTCEAVWTVDIREGS